VKKDPSVPDKDNDAISEITLLAERCPAGSQTGPFFSALSGQVLGGKHNIKMQGRSCPVSQKSLKDPWGRYPIGRVWPQRIVYFILNRLFANILLE
jgi:hypothetical protein